MGAKFTDDEDSVVLVERQSPLVDFDGNDAMLVSTEDLRIACQRVAQAAMPFCVNRALQIIGQGKDREALEAMKFISSVADGTVKAKAVKGQLNKMTDGELIEVLNGTAKED